MKKETALKISVILAIFFSAMMAFSSIINVALFNLAHVEVEGMVGSAGFNIAFAINFIISVYLLIIASKSLADPRKNWFLLLISVIGWGIITDFAFYIGFGHGYVQSYGFLGELIPTAIIIIFLIIGKVLKDKSNG